MILNTKKYKKYQFIKMKICINRKTIKYIRIFEKLILITNNIKSIKVKVIQKFILNKPFRYNFTK